MATSGGESHRPVTSTRLPISSLDRQTKMLAQHGEHFFWSTIRRIDDETTAPQTAIGALMAG